MFEAVDGFHIDDIDEIGDISIEIVMPMGRCRGFQRLFEWNALHPFEMIFEKFIGFFSIQSVIACSAGPPLGGLYLNPPSEGGLCEGVMTIPSASLLFRSFDYM